MKSRTWWDRRDRRPSLSLGLCLLRLPRGPLARRDGGGGRECGSPRGGHGRRRRGSHQERHRHAHLGGLRKRGARARGAVHLERPLRVPGGECACERRTGRVQGHPAPLRFGKPRRQAGPGPSPHRSGFGARHASAGPGTPRPETGRRRRPGPGARGRRCSRSSPEEPPGPPPGRHPRLERPGGRHRLSPSFLAGRRGPGGDVPGGGGGREPPGSALRPGTRRARPVSRPVRPPRSRSWTAAGRRR